MTELRVSVPDLGGIDEVEVIELCVASGDQVETEDAIIVLESDKATMEVPVPQAGVIESFLVAVGDRVSSGTEVAVLRVADASSNNGATNEDEAPAATEAAKVEQENEAVSESNLPADKTGTTQDVVVPDLGGIDEVEVIELSASEGDELEAEDSLIVLESDKATMEVPMPIKGQVLSFKVKVGDKVKQGDVVATVETLSSSAQSSGEDTATVSKSQTAPQQSPSASTKEASKSAPKPLADLQVSASKSGQAHAGPAVRKLARELGVDLSMVPGTGPKNRILKEDLHSFVKVKVNQSGSASVGVVGSQEDFSKYGPIQEVSLNKIKQVTAKNMVQSWTTVPQVTQFDEADITELEHYRKTAMVSMLPEGVKVSPLAFIMKACAHALKAFPNFNSSLGPDGTTLILKQFFHVGIAVDTPEGLLVPVVKDVDQKGVVNLAKESAELAKKARDKKLPLDAMSGGCFTISSLGGIGGTAFTPIVSAPQVAILGVSKAQMKPVWNGKEFEPRLMLPLSLSYDHRVIDGAEAARFARYLCELLSDTRHLLL